MADKLRSLIKVIENGLHRHRFLVNARTGFNNVTENAQKKLNNVQSIVASKYDIVSKQINSEIAIFQDLNAAQLQQGSSLPKKLAKWWKWYQELTGLDTVELAKQQVIFAQDKLFKCQEDRRHLNKEVTILNDKLKEIYAELVQTKRDDPKYVQLTIIENKNLQEQARIISQLNFLERDEKEHFTLLATAIKEYHDSQALNAQKYKYLSILASALLAIISLTCSMIYNNKRITDVRFVIDEAQKKNQAALNNGLSYLQNTVDVKFSKILEEVTKRSPREESTATSSKSISVYQIAGIGFLGYLFLKLLIG